MNKIKSLFFIVIMASMVTLSGCNHNSDAAQNKVPVTEAVPVEVALASHNPISASYRGTASLVADHEADVVAKATGVVMKIYVEEGMHVKAGQLLAKLDDADALAKAKQAEAQMHKAQATFAHAQAAMPKHLIAEFEYEQDKFDLQAQRAAYEAAKIQLQNTRVVAPVSGVIAQRKVKVGNMVQTNGVMFHLVGMNPLQAVLNVPERQLGILKPGQAVELQADALPGKHFTGTILRIAPVIDPATGTFRVTCQFRDDSDVLRPGMFARIDIVYDKQADALTIPRSALVEEDGATSVFIVEKAPAGKASAEKTKTAKADVKTSAVKNHGLIAHLQKIKVGYSDGNQIQVLSGLKRGQRVITVGRNAVRDGTTILVLGDKA